MYESHGTHVGEKFFEKAHQMPGRRKDGVEGEEQDVEGSTRRRNGIKSRAGHGPRTGTDS